MLRTLYRSLRSHCFHSLIPESRYAIPAASELNIEVVGLHSLSVGIGVSARLCAERLSAAGFNVNCRDVTKAFLKEPELAWDWDNRIAEDGVNCRIFHLNPPMMPVAVYSVGLRNYRSSYNIGYWAWESDILPREWQRAIRYTNAMFVPSRFNQDVFRKYTDKPLCLVPHPVAVKDIEPGVRASLGFEETDFVACFVFSFGSSFERKNPLATIESFSRAFGDADNAYLVLKSSHGAQYPDDFARLQAAIAGSSKIRLIDEVWPMPRVMGLIAESDVFISLHRSEGFGLSIAEAISLEVPVIATAWSGNTDFCDPDNTYPVATTLTAIESTHQGFASLEGAHWATPDARQAATDLKAIYDHPDAAKQRARRAKDFMEGYLAEYTYPKAMETLATLAAGKSNQAG
jgi:glycosyltransferase involved in cell wall biosynthesis